MAGEKSGWPEKSEGSRRKVRVAGEKSGWPEKSQGGRRIIIFICNVHESRFVQVTEVSLFIVNIASPSVCAELRQWCIYKT